MTDIPALIERLNRYSCQEHTALGDDDGCVACEVWQDTRDAATALAEQAGEIERLEKNYRAAGRMMSEYAREKLALEVEIERLNAQMVEAVAIHDNQQRLRVQLAEARKALQDIKNMGGGDDSYLYCWERARQWLASTEKQ